MGGYGVAAGRDWLGCHEGSLGCGRGSWRARRYRAPDARYQAAVKGPTSHAV